MPERHDRTTICAIAVVSIGLAAILHEGLGHGLTAWLRGNAVTELTSNHLSSTPPDRWVHAAGTIVNLLAAAICFAALHRAGNRSNFRYFLWLFGSINLLQSAGYFLFSGALGLGDWFVVIQGLPYESLLRVGMAAFGAIFYFRSVKWIAAQLRPFIADRTEYNTLARLPYLVASGFYCLAGAFDPLGIQLLFISTIPAAFGGMSGLLWADSRLPSDVPQNPLPVQKSRAWTVAAALFAILFVAVFGRGIVFTR
jgi:hypothetical protein